MTTGTTTGTTSAPAKADAARPDFDALARGVLDAAREAGMGLEVRFSHSRQLRVKVRKGALEELRHTAPAGAGLRVFAGDRSVSGSTSHVTERHLQQLWERLRDNVALVGEDAANGLADRDLQVTETPALDLVDPTIETLDVARCREMALACEQAAMGVDPRIRHSSGAGVSYAASERRIYNTNGLAASDAGTNVAVWASPVAEDEKGDKFSGSWFSSACHLADMESARAVGVVAGRKAIELIGARKIASTKAPVLFIPDTARALIDLVFQCAAGDRVYKKATWLADKEGAAVASELVTLRDDPHRARGLRSRAFDDEGVATQPRKLIDGGRLTFVPCDTYAARRLGRKSTGHSGRALGGTAAIQAHNLSIDAGAATPEKLIAGMNRGLIVSSFIGFSFNHASGDFSRGARGFWVEKGRIAHPVHEITVSGNLGDMLKGIVGVGSDLEHRYGIDSPSLLVEGMTISGSSA